VEAEKVGVIPYMLKLDYDYWTYRTYVILAMEGTPLRYSPCCPFTDKGNANENADDIMTAILPEEDQDEIPVGFTQVGHIGTSFSIANVYQEYSVNALIAHLNLRPPYEPYKHLLAQILLSKNPHLRTIINKTSTIDPNSTFRTFSYELLAGDPDLNVEMKSSDCTFHFDYSKVYWNSRLNTEHRRLVGLFRPGEAVCDVMAGVGPFAVPAGRKGVFVWANDLNPESFGSLSDAIVRNKVNSPIQLSMCDLANNPGRLRNSSIHTTKTPKHSSQTPSTISSKPQQTLLPLL